jgi:hypothetical protein
MHNLTQEQLYSKLIKKANIVSGYLNNNIYSFIIQYCRLKPYSLFIYTPEKFKNIKLEKYWLDEHNNSLKIHKRGGKIIIGDIKTRTINIINTDIFYKRKIKDIAKMASYILIQSGKTVDNKNCYIIAFLCIDKCIRSYLCIENDIENYPPLQLNMSALKLLKKSNMIRSYKEFNIDSIVPMNEVKTYLSIFPITKNFLTILDSKIKTIIGIE